MGAKTIPEDETKKVAWDVGDRSQALQTIHFPAVIRQRKERKRVAKTQIQMGKGAHVVRKSACTF